ncbi:ABC transporter ATP-binding protein [Spiractinospora alimapuensis]|uniref:ABC transporter ATP-binding protein n=1 Tax=Spiractinospora alimapuensis TaxID=2820884 RepID=UPI001F4460F4|nr:ABC transporter ATP-binding protein [Spiractinospora alimapuensis]QVQ50971.1 ABC transporter ATP-binding protein [Spiractinospora alimapuensis]
MTGVWSDAVLRADELRVRLGGTEVLRGLSFEIPAGAVVGLLGPSGSGKTTVMRAVVGAQTIAGGWLSVLGRPAGDPALRRLIGYAAQTPAVYGDLTVRQNLRYFASVLRAPRGDVRRVLAEVALEDESGRRVDRLSGGQQTRVSLAVALLGTPRLLVLDEPTVGLDPVLREELWAIFRRLADRGNTLLVSSHVMDEAERCDRLLLLRGGELVAATTPDELRGATGRADMDSAFLALIRGNGGGNRRRPDGDEHGDRGGDLG